LSRKRGNGEGSIYRRNDGRWVGQYMIYTAKGPKYRYLYGKTRAKVAEKLTKAMANRNSGLVFDAGKMTLGEYLDRWLSDSVRGTVRASTYERHEAIIRVHIKPSLGRVGLKKLTPAHVRGYTARSSTPGWLRPRFARSTPRSTRPSLRPSRMVWSPETPPT
jgi:integrase